MNTVKNAIGRIKWRFQNGSFNPNEKDFEALNFIIDWVNIEKNQIFNNNPLLAKCYTLLLKYEIMKYQDVKFASKILNQKLHKNNVEQVLEELRDYLNLIEYQEFLKRYGLKINHPAEMTKEETIKEMEIIKEHEAEFLNITVKGKWTIEKVREAIINQLTELIKLK